GAAQLDGQVAEAAARVEPAGGGERGRGAGVQAGGAGAAVAGLVGGIGLKRQGGEQGAGGEKNAQVPVEEHGGLCEPSPPGPAARAKSRSSSGAVSTTPRPRQPGTSPWTQASNSLSRCRSTS